MVVQQSAFSFEPPRGSCRIVGYSESIVGWRKIPITLKMPGTGILSVLAWFRQLRS